MSDGSSLWVVVVLGLWEVGEAGGEGVVEKTSDMVEAVVVVVVVVGGGWGGGEGSELGSKGKDGKEGDGSERCIIVVATTITGLECKRADLADCLCGQRGRGA